MMDTNLTHFELETAVRFLTQHMSMDTRQQMMAEFPVLYAKMTGADPAAILAQVADGLRQVDQAQWAARIAKATATSDGA
jgi:hypothetical protein